MKRPTIAESAWVAETATVRADVTLAQDVSVWFGAVLRGDEAPIEVGARSNIQDCAVVHVTREHPVRIGADVTVGHGAVVHGCTVEDGALIGMGATVLDGAVVGAGAIVGAGALVATGHAHPAGHPCRRRPRQGPRPSHPGAEGGDPQGPRPLPRAQGAVSPR